MHVRCRRGQVNVPGVRLDQMLRVQLLLYGTSVVVGGLRPLAPEAVGFSV